MRRQLGQQTAGQDVFDISRAAFDLGAAAGNLGDQIFVPAQFGAVILKEALANAVELKRDNLANDVVGERKIRDDRTTAQESRLERLEQFRAQRIDKFL